MASAMGDPQPTGEQMSSAAPLKKGRFSVREINNSGGDDYSGSGGGAGMPLTQSNLSVARVTVSSDTGEMELLLDKGKLLSSPASVSHHHLQQQQAPSHSGRLQQGWEQSARNRDSSAGGARSISNLSSQRSYASVDGVDGFMEPSSFQGSPPSQSPATAGTGSAADGLAATAADAGADVQKQMGRFLVREIGGTAPVSAATSAYSSVDGGTFSVSHASHASRASSGGRSDDGALPPGVATPPALQIETPLAQLLLEQNKLVLERLAAMELSMAGRACSPDLPPTAAAAAAAAADSSSRALSSSKAAAAAPAAQPSSTGPSPPTAARASSFHSAGGGEGAAARRTDGARLGALLAALRAEVDAAGAARRDTELEMKVLREKNRSLEERLRGEAARAAAAEAKLERAKARNRALGDDNAALRVLLCAAGVARLPSPPPPDAQWSPHAGAAGRGAQPPQQTMEGAAPGHSGGSGAAVPPPLPLASPRAAQAAQQPQAFLSSAASMTRLTAAAAPAEKAHTLHTRQASFGGFPTAFWPGGANPAHAAALPKLAFDGSLLCDAPKTPVEVGGGGGGGVWGSQALLRQQQQQQQAAISSAMVSGCSHAPVSMTTTASVSAAATATAAAAAAQCAPPQPPLKHQAQLHYAMEQAFGVANLDALPTPLHQLAAPAVLNGVEAAVGAGDLATGDLRLGAAAGSGMFGGMQQHVDGGSGGGGGGSGGGGGGAALFAPNEVHSAIMSAYNRPLQLPPGATAAGGHVGGGALQRLGMPSAQQQQIPAK
ncbi:hypothetical protein JKP88DRAFT_268536 [Tribonema minus]|uniref:Uncharacterized protein n=1 Tax=Tribonema minus TaxID=303371 RepID=A0A836CI65_9STRA|nr:hypothetical protein JKP88DRAFT_268536 [Tribonema minus]